MERGQSQETGSEDGGWKREEGRKIKQGSNGVGQRDDTKCFSLWGPRWFQGQIMGDSGPLLHGFPAGNPP